MRFDTYIQSIQSNLQRGSERTHYPALKNLLDNPKAGIDTAIEEKGNKAGIPDFTVRRRQLLREHPNFAKIKGLPLFAKLYRELGFLLNDTNPEFLVESGRRLFVQTGSTRHHVHHPSNKRFEPGFGCSPN
jgi:hypothetical protein